MTPTGIFRDWRIATIAGAALLHLTAFAGAWVMVPHDGVETRLDRPMEASLMPAPSSELVDNDSTEVAKEVSTLNEQGETAPEDTAEVVPPDAVTAQTVQPAAQADIAPPEPVKPQDQAEAPAEPLPQQLATLAPEIVTTTSPDVVTSAPVVPPAEPAKTVPSRPEPTKPKPQKVEKPKPEKDVRKKPEPVVKPQPSPKKMAKLDTKTTIARTQVGGAGAISDVGASGSAAASGATLKSYGAILQAQARSRLRYPPGARDRGIKGTARVSFIVTGQGSVGSVRLASSAGDPALDAAALAAIRSLSPPPPPGGRFYTILPLTFRMLN